MKAAIYARFSSHNQREESIEGQVRACKRFAKEHGMTIVEIYADRGLSGLHADNRPEFQRMIQDSDHHRFEALIMWNLDRFSRDKYDTAVYKTRLKKNGVSLYYSDQSIPDTPEGIILESLLEGFAQYYSANLARNAKRGLQENARKCLWNGGCVPLGYLIDEHQRFVLEPIGAACVRMIFELYASGQSIKSIVCTLNEKGYKTVKGNRFRLGSIQGILRNRKYIGEYHASGITVPNGIPAIVDVQLFNDVQARLGVVASAKAHNKADIPYLLTTKVFCGHCGSPMIGESGTGKGGATYRYYKCSCRKNRKGTCDKKTEPKDWLEENVVRQTVKNVLRPEVIKEISENCAAALKADASDESLVQALKAQLAETDKALRNLLKAIEAGIISSTTRERMAELESQKSELEAQIAREQLRKPEITAEQISFWLESFLAGDIHDPKYQERIINALVRRVDVYDDGPEKQKLTIFYNITKNNRSFSKISISKCSDIECIALPAVDHRDAHADHRQRRRVAQKRRVAVSIHQQQRQNHAENRLQERIDRHAGNRIHPQQHRPKRIRHRREQRQIQQHDVSHRIIGNEPPARREAAERHHRAAEHELPAAHNHRAVKLAEFLNQPRAARRGDHRNDDESLADQAHPAAKAVLRPVDDDHARHADQPADPLERVHPLRAEDEAGNQNRRKRLKPLNDRALRARRVRHADVKEHVLNDRLRQRKLHHVAPTRPLRKRGRLSRDAFKQNRQKARQKEAAAAEENLRRRVACGHAEIAIAQIDKRNRAAPEQAAQAGQQHHHQRL